MTYPGERVRVDVKVVAHRYITDPELWLFWYTAMDEFTRLRFLAAYPEIPLQTFSNNSQTGVLTTASEWSVGRQIMGLSSQTAFPTAKRISPHFSSRPSVSGTIPFAPTRYGTTARPSAVTVRSRSGSTTPMLSFP